MEHVITKGQLEQLVDDCLNVLNDNRLAQKLLPAKGGQKIDFSGLFRPDVSIYLPHGAVSENTFDTFGNTEYDSFYFEDLSRTVGMVTEVLKTTDWEQEVITYYEWW